MHLLIEGTKNWKKVTGYDSGLKLHNRSASHKDCMVAWESYNQTQKFKGGPVFAQLSDAYKQLIKIGIM